MDPQLLKQLQDAKRLAVNRLLRPNFYGNVVGVGFGRKLVGGEVTETRCLRIYVQAKRTPDVLSPAVAVPDSFLDIPTDIVEIGRLGRAGNRKTTRELTRDDHPQQGVGPGSSIRLQTKAPNVNQAACGTLGAVVQCNGKQYLLSCNHVLAVNGRVPDDAEIVTPALAEKPTPIGTPTKYFVPLERGQNNEVDCALAALVGRGVIPKFRSVPGGIGMLDPDCTDPDVGQKVQKDGAVTGVTSGTVVDTHADLFVDLSFGTLRFSDQVIIDGGGEEPFAGDGDSGALVVAEIEQNGKTTKKAVAMIFAETGRFAVACPLGRVLDQLAVQLGKGAKLTLVTKQIESAAAQATPGQVPAQKPPKPTPQQRVYKKGQPAKKK